VICLDRQYRDGPAAMKEATAHIRINKLLEATGWRFFPEGDARADIRLEQAGAIKFNGLDALGKEFLGTYL
jgi:type I restriction enzyme R subunit